MRRSVKNINPEYSFLLTETDKLYDVRIKQFVEPVIKQGWQIIAVDQQRGTCYYGRKLVTIPMYAIRKGIADTTYYIAHEISHVYAGSKANHGALFMQWLKKICPQEWQYMEYEYKPRNALIAGLAITKEMLM